MEENTASIALVDNTVPSQQPSNGDSPQRSSTTGRQSHLSRHLSRVSVSGQLAKRKYAKWQPGRLGVTSDAETSLSRESSRVRGSASAASSGGPATRQPSQQDSGLGLQESDTVDFAPTRTQSHTNDTTNITGGNRQAPASGEKKPVSELDVLYENQRGSFIFGIPLYSHSSLLNFDPSAWMTQDKSESPVNITNAQLPDPSWEWSWRTWYVDMSGDVDEQGWQYSFSFSSSQWHGTHPWFHSWVRRRRWVRLRTKIPEKRPRGRSGFEQAHMLTEDYFTIHSSKVRSREQSVTGLSRVESGFLSRVSTKMDEEAHLEEIGDIPTLMHALKLTSIDREKIDVLKKFVEEGGEEIYYLNDKIPEIMSTFLFQASRWQFVTYLVSVIHRLSKSIPDPENKDSERITRKKDNLIQAVESAKQHVTGPDVFADTHGDSGGGLFDLTPRSRHDILLSIRAKATDEPLLVTKAKEIRGIPKAAEVGREAHIY
ncbi:Meiotically protein [Penicillium argentinense]|uniref:Meiotically protein n=1 Tax=Penicillium argentinense TaxID=1131581 RepID=A0A9W9FPI7_9EURO|nr:Meiotically protein [Penicillium argentinense]KAJ5103989.1 Meiotically protein [Penicillium argentinense]